MTEICFSATTISASHCNIGLVERRMSLELHWLSASLFTFISAPSPRTALIPERNAAASLLLCWCLTI